MKHYRIPALALTGALTLSLLLSACGGNTEPTPTPTQPATPPAEETLSPSPTTEPTVTPSAEPSPELTPAESGELVQSQPVTTPEPSTEPTPEPAADVSVTDLWNSISAELDPPALMDLDDSLLSDLYGISADDLDEYVAKMPLMNVHATEFFLAKVKSGKMETVKAGVSKRLEDLKAQWEQYLPEQLELVNNAQVVENGDYLLFCISEDAESVVEEFNNSTQS